MQDKPLKAKPPTRAKMIGRSRAIAAVRRAVLRGDLPRLDGSIACVDCGVPASNYDHRDYSKPLEVEPVCISCNSWRGPAKYTTDDPEYASKRKGEKRAVATRRNVSQL